MDGGFKKVNQNVNLGRRPAPAYRPARQYIAILKDGFFWKSRPIKKQTGHSLHWKMNCQNNKTVNHQTLMG